MDITQAKALQQQLREKVDIRSVVDLSAIKTVGGTDVGFAENGRVTRAVFVVLSFPELTLLESVVVERPTCFPYVPGYLSFRELPPLAEAYQQLAIKPDVTLCDGQGIAHPRRFGLACHLGVELGIITVGVAKKRLTGVAREPATAKNSATPLMDGDEQLGWLLRSRTAVKPVFVSPGHGINVQQSLDIVRACCTRTRLPEPTRIADRLSKASREERGVRRGA